MKKKTDNYKNFQRSIGLQYPDTTFANCVKSLEISQKEIMNAVGHTNPVTCAKWISGSDIYLRSLLEICNQTGIDLLSLLQYYGHSFKSSIEDLYRLEITGSTVADILRERGIDSGDSRNLMNEEQRANINQRLIEQAEAFSTSRKKTEDADITMTGIIDRIIDIQAKAHEHEIEALDCLRKESREIIDNQRDYYIARMEEQRSAMQAEMERQVNDRQKHIDRLLNEVAMLKAQLADRSTSASPMRYPLVSDQTQPGQ